MPLTFLPYELERIDHRQFCRASFTAYFYYRDKFLKIYLNVEKLIIQIESGILRHPLWGYRVLVCITLSTNTNTFNIWLLYAYIGTRYIYSAWLKSMVNHCIMMLNSIPENRLFLLFSHY